MLRMSLNEIRGKIQINPEYWINLYTTNCYAYALGLDLVESDICISAYQPGTISGVDSLGTKEYFTYNELIAGIESDLNILMLNYKEVDFNYVVSENEWKIALFIQNCSCDKLNDFHFLRTVNGGVWTHKDGFVGYPTKKDYLGHIIENPVDSFMCSYEYKKCYVLNKR